MKTAEAKKRIISACSTGMKNTLLDYELDNILKSYAKEHAIEFLVWAEDYGDISAEQMYIAWIKDK